MLNGFNVSRLKEAIFARKGAAREWTVRKANKEGLNSLSDLRKGVYMHGTPTVAGKYTHSACSIVSLSYLHCEADWGVDKIVKGW